MHLRVVFALMVSIFGFSSSGFAIPPGEYLGTRNPVWLAYTTKKSDTQALYFFAEYRRFEDRVFRSIGWLIHDSSKKFEFTFLGGARERTVVARDRENGSVYLADLKGNLSEPIARSVQTLQPMSRSQLLLGQGNKLMALDPETRVARELYEAKGKILAVERSALNEIHWIEAGDDTNHFCGGQLFHWPWRIHNVGCKDLKPTKSPPNRLLVSGDSVWMESFNAHEKSWGQILTRTTQHYGNVFTLPASEYNALDLTNTGVLQLRLKDMFLVQAAGAEKFSPNFSGASVHAVFSPKSNEWLLDPANTHTATVQSVRDGHEDWLLSTFELCAQPSQPLDAQK